MQLHVLQIKYGYVKKKNIAACLGSILTISKHKP